MDKRCQSCNQMNPPEAAFCRNCAAPLTQNRQNNPHWNQPNFGNQPNPGNQGNFANPAQGQTPGGASTRATASLILAIAGLFCCAVTGIPAAILGWMEIGAIKRGESSPAGMMMAQIGLWGGIAITILSFLGGFLYILMIAAAVSDPYGY